MLWLMAILIWHMEAGPTLTPMACINHLVCLFCPYAVLVTTHKITTLEEMQIFISVLKQKSKKSTRSYSVINMTRESEIHDIGVGIRARSKTKNIVDMSQKRGMEIYDAICCVYDLKEKSHSQKWLKWKL